ncbi:MAG: nucleotidyltransferase family protein [Pseudomonadota bacterium]
MPLPSVAILCGGLATRLRPITNTLPKALVDVSGRPFIFYQLDQLKQQGISEIVLCVGYLGEMIEEVVGDGRKLDLHIQYSYDGEKYLGTGGALRKALRMLGEEFFILYGDAYLQIDYAAAYKLFKSSSLPGLMSVFHNAGQWDTSNVLYDGGEILAYSKTNKTPRMRHIDYGMGILQTAVLEPYPEGETLDLADVYERLAQEHGLAAYEASERFYEIGSHSGLQDFEKWLAEPQ